MESKAENREKLIKCAKAEFLEKGFEKASLRKICADAGLTTGAVYFFFKDKNGLLGAFADELIGRVKNELEEYFSSDKYSPFSGDASDSFREEITEKLTDIMYSDRDTLMIVLTKAQGSQYENILDEIIDMTDAFYRRAAEKCSDGREINDFVLHWLAHLNVNAFVHLATHEPDKETALRRIKPMVQYLASGRKELIFL